MEDAEAKVDRSRWLESAPAILGASTSLLYVPGFIVVNAFMATKGVAEQPLLSSRYVAAGALFLVASLLFYFQVLKHVVRRARSGITMSREWPQWFQAFLQNYFFIEALFRTAFYSALLIVLTAPSFGAFSALALAALVAVVDGWIFSKERWTPITRFVVSAVLFAAALTGFVTLGVFEPTMIAVFGVALLFLVATVAVLTSEGWSTGEDRNWGVVFLGIYGLLAAVAFGATVYGGIPAKYGGGAPPKVQIVFATDAESGLQEVLASAKGSVFLVASTEDAYVLEFIGEAHRKSTVRMARSQVAGILHESTTGASDYVRVVEWIRALVGRAAQESR